MPAETDEGYRPALGNRQVQMIAIGGAIGVGLFLGAGGRLAASGPALVLSYAAAGVAAFFVMRALGELVLYRPASGSFVEYAGEFVGPWAAFASGWMYWLNWAFTGIAELTAIAAYVHYWAPAFPQWATALLALAFVLVVNLLSVRLFGELEFWFALLKVLAIVTFLVVGLVLVVFAVGQAGPGNLVAHGGFLPAGFPMVLMSLQSVVFAYASIELVGIAAGETARPREVIPKAVNGVVWRIAIFYVGSVLLLAMVLPWTAYEAGTSPFVTVFAGLGVPWAADAMNLVVITAALFYFLPARAFNIATAAASLGVITTWGTLVYCQLRLRATGHRSAFPMPGSPYTNWLTLAFLALVVVLMPFADDDQRVAFFLLPVVAAAIAAGWAALRRRGRAAAPADPAVAD
ncbi:amino acid permease [Nonomuraea sp. NPDC003214]